jgi:mannosyl-3-phosphoglycerate phosphatase
MNNWLIFTDLDGTLLDHHDYNFVQALPALEKIRDLQIPLIINSSKTYAEIKDIRRQMQNKWAFAVENGAALFLPDGGLSGNDNNLQQIILGKPHSEILKMLRILREQHNLSFMGFSDYTTKALMAETGLTETQANQAKQRLASEPLKWLDSQQNLVLFEQVLEAQDLQLIQGGRFLHVMGQNDKSLAMTWLLNNFNQLQKSLTLALGDSQNDQKMLEQADFAAVIRNKSGNYLQLNKNPEQVIFSRHPAPLGWQEVMDQLFTKLSIGTPNE